MADARLTEYLLTTSPVIRYAFDPAKDSMEKDRTDEHLHETQYQITCGLDPEGTIRIGNQEYRVGNAFFLIPPLTLHTLENDAARTFPNITCRFELPGFSGKWLGNRIQLGEAESETAKQYLLRVSFLQNHSEEHLRARAPLALAELLFFLDENAPVREMEQETATPFSSALRYMQENFKSSINIEMIAQQVGISQEHLSRLFSREMGTTPSDYLQRLRLGYAVERLFASRRKLGCIALEAGFSNAKTFNAAFSKHYQCSAGQFRKRHIEKEAEND